MAVSKWLRAKSLWLKAKQIEGEVLLGLLLFFFFMFLSELEKQLLSIGTTCGVQAIIASMPCAFDQRLGRLGVTEQILLHITANLFVVRLKKEGTIHVINVLGNRLHIYTTFTNLGENL